MQRCSEEFCAVSRSLVPVRALKISALHVCTSIIVHKYTNACRSLYAMYACKSSSDYHQRIGTHTHKRCNVKAPQCAQILRVATVTCSSPKRIASSRTGASRTRGNARVRLSILIDKWAEKWRRRVGVVYMRNDDLANPAAPALYVGLIMCEILHTTRQKWK